MAGLLPVVFTSVLGEAQVDLPMDGIDIVHSITQTPQTWLDNKVYELDDGLGIDWDAPAALFPPGLLEAMFAAYVALPARPRRCGRGVDDHRPLARPRRAARRSSPPSTPPPAPGPTTSCTPRCSPPPRPIPRRPPSSPRTAP